MENGIQSDLIRGHVNTIILKALYESDKYGYEICKEISERSVGQYELKQPTLYSCLKRLEKQGWIKSYWGTTVSNGGRRRYYTLSDLGQDMYLKSQAEWEYSRTLIDKLVSDKPYDLNTAPPPEINLKLVPVTKRKPQEKTVAEEDNEIAGEDGAEEETFSASPPDKESEKLKNEPVQYDLFDKLKVDVDKNIAEYDAVTKMYDETNIRTQRDREEAIHSNADTEVAAPCDEARTVRAIGFDEATSKFLDVAPEEPLREKKTESEPPRTVSYTAAILSESQAKAREILFSAPVEPLELKTFESDSDDTPPVLEPVAVESAETAEEMQETEQQIFPAIEEKQETQAEKEYKNILNKLLNTAKTHSAVSADEKIVSESAIGQKSNEADDAAEQANAESAATGTNIKTYDDKIIVETDDYSLIPHRQRGNLDFTELQSKMQTEGFKIRAHAKETEVSPTGSIYANKLMLATLSVVFALVAAELLVIYFAANRFLMIPNSTYITLGSVATAMLIAAAIFCGVNPNRKLRDRFQFGVSFGLSAILTVLAFVASFAVACLAASQLSITAELFKSVVLPTILALNMPIGVTVYAILKKSSKFQV